jgi:hypothetical protein
VLTNARPHVTLSSSGAARRTKRLRFRIDPQRHLPSAATAASSPRRATHLDPPRAGGWLHYVFGRSPARRATLRRAARRPGDFRGEDLPGARTRRGRRSRTRLRMRLPGVDTRRHTRSRAAAFRVEHPGGASIGLPGWMIAACSAIAKSPGCAWRS